MLLPLNTEKFVNIIQSDTTLKYADSAINAYGKDNYKELFSNELSRTATAAEDNSIPIYDLNFTFLQSVNLSKHENAINWLKKHQLLNFLTENEAITSSDSTQKIPLSSLLLLDSESGRLDTDTSDSILIKPLLTVLAKYPQIFSEATKKEIIHDLIGQMDLYSSVRFLSPVGHITKLSDKVISGFVNDKILSANFSDENIFNIQETLTQTQNFQLTPTTLPQNQLLNCDLRYGLQIKDQDTFYNQQVVPTAYFNILYLKNNRNPHYNIDYNINLNNAPIIDYNIVYSPKYPDNLLNANITNGAKITDYSALTNNECPIRVINNPVEDKNSNMNRLFDFDITHSYEVNCVSLFKEGFKDLTKERTKELLNYAAQKDYELSLNYSNGYATSFPRRLVTKIDDYLEPYRNYHVAHNKIYNMGELNGIRNYIHVGTLIDSDKLWFSYKYKSVYDNNFVDSYAQTYNLNFSEYKLNRIQNHWKLDIYGNIVTTNIMKTNYQVCPWITNLDRAKAKLEYPELQKLIGCNCKYSDICSGFCIFPTENKLEIPNGLVWNRNGNTFYTISENEYDRELIVESDIEVNDDLEIYFVDSNTYNADIIEIENADKTADTLSSVFLSIYQGFGGIFSEIKTPEYLARNNSEISGFTIAKHSPFNCAHTITQGSRLTGLNWTTKKIEKILPKGFKAVFRVRSWFSDTVKCTGKIKTQVYNQTINTMPADMEDVLNITSKYDYVERNYGFFKYQQENLHKSNIYSIKLSNTGLNPENDLKLIIVYSFEQLINKMCAAGKPTRQNEYSGNNRDYILKYEYGDNLTDGYFYRPQIIIEELDPLRSQLKTKIYPDIEYYSTNTISKIVSGWTDPLDLRLGQGINIIKFNTLKDELNWEIVYDENGNFLYAYNTTDKLDVQRTNRIKNNMRELLETAIKASVKDYMPVETTLWKIIYTGT